jgi:hypothetical protein
MHALCSGAEAFRVTHEIRRRGRWRSGGCRRLLLDAAHVTGAVGKYNRQWNAMADRGHKLVGGVEEAAVARDGENRRVPPVLCAQRGGKAPAGLSW